MKRCTLISGLNSYLEAQGAFNGSPEDIIEAKKAYRKKYQATWKKEKRKREKEIETYWKQEELQELRTQSKKHQSSLPAFIKSATFAYMRKSYVVPNSKEVRYIAQQLAMVYNELQALIEDDRISTNTGKTILQTVLNLEHSVRSMLFNPKSLEDVVLETIGDDSHKKSALIQLLTSLP